MGVQRWVSAPMKISAKGQVVIPSHVREKYGWERGVFVRVIETESDKIVLQKVSPQKSLVAKYRGSLKGKLPSTHSYLSDKSKDLQKE